MTSDLYSYEVDFLRAGLKQLKPYLLSDEVFWSLGLRLLRSTPPYPQLTLGNLLLSKARLSGLQSGQALSAEQQDEMESLNAELEKTHEDWQVAWMGKAQKEFELRLRQWARYLDELSQVPGRHTASFANAVRVRALLELLRGYLPDSVDGVRSEVGVLDQRLKRVTRVGEFIWEEAVKAAFPQDDYWFLYTELKTP